ncbi:hypothetical protein [Streptomyces abyssomicinicus]|uniref:hypothetical protein n=1 Tax=Streptomyces abyssomicinicus TaxID=574929 RepID=UPI00124FB1E0|nr:hypothetical protein [Streptomyces abyssomicinicus]
MPRTPRRKIPGLVGTSCLAAALVVPAGVTAGLAQPAQAAPATAQQAQPTPPPPDPGTQEPATPEQPAPDTQEPGTEDPGTQEPGTDDPGTEDPGTSDPGTSTEEPGTGESDPADLPPGEQVEQAVGDIEALPVPEKVKADLKQAVDRLAALIDDPGTSAADRKIYAQVLEHVTEMLGLVDDPETSPAERRALIAGLQAVDEMMKKALDDGASRADRASYKKLTLGLTGAVTRMTDPDHAGDGSTPPPKPTQGVKEDTPPVQADRTSQGMNDALDEGTRPQQPEDRKKIEGKAKSQVQAFVTAQDPSATDEDRAAAEKELDEPARSAGDPRYREVLEQVEEYNASDACVSLLEKRTRQSGWASGSLWGLSDPVCDRPRSAGAEDTSSKWNKLFVCVDQESFSTCTAYIPED